MKVIVNGKEKELKKGATLKTAIEGEVYNKGTLIAVHLSEEKLVKETSDFEIETTRGTLVMHLNDSPEAKVWKDSVSAISGMSARWVTHNIAAFGSFPTDLKVDRSENGYRIYDCFLSLGGFDSSTTYLMIARDNHRGSYGAGKAVIGRVTVGRHLLPLFKEGDEIISVRPMMSEISTENVVVTKDLAMKLEDGYKVETMVSIDLDKKSPLSAEHILVLSSTGYMKATDVTGSYIACSEDLDVEIPVEDTGIRDKGTVAVRCDGLGQGRLYILKDKRQQSSVHNIAGKVTNGMAIVGYAKKDDIFTIATNPPRALAVGMTMKAGEEFLKNAGITMEREGDTSDDAIIVEQTPEQTVTALAEGKVKVKGVPKEKVFKITLEKQDDPRSVHYFRKITGLSHKPVGSMTVQFTFEGLPMVTFYGDEMKGKDIVPHDKQFKKCKRGDIGITNQARPHHGLMGIRLEDSKEYGPTGEEPYGTNIIGKFDDDLDRLMKDLNDDDVVYIREVEL
ncbi:MAG: methanogenesis marker 3 protein [Candidatus Methanomethylophilaceae archaeon]|nr:methanogenesis marker 3 protein [Candidatus Methanomethylophilaceae archaeon]